MRKEATMMRNSAIPRLLLGLLVCAASPLFAAEKDGVHVCIGADHVVRHAPGAACRSGEASYLLAEEKGDIDAPGQEKDADRELRELKDKLNALSERVANVERAGHDSGKAATSRVMAPFEVLDPSGKAIFRVTANAADQERTDSAPILIARMPESGNYWLRMRSKSGAEAMDLGMTPVGQGYMLAYDPTQGKARGLFGWRGVNVFDSGGIEAATLMTGSAGGGQMILSKDNKLMVEAGSTGEGRGVVRVGPFFTCTGNRLANGMGTADCIMGRLSGSIK
jgi:hypothetical protein